MDDPIESLLQETGEAGTRQEAGARPNHSDAIGQIESGGRYDAIGPPDSYGRRPYGKHQVMEQNIPEWTEAATGRAMTPMEYLGDPLAQEMTFEHKFDNEYVPKYGPEGAARAWFAGERGMNNFAATDSNGTSVQRYGEMFNDQMERAAPEAPETRQEDPLSKLMVDSGEDKVAPPAPPTPPPPEPSETDTGFWSTMKGAAAYGASQGWQDTKLAAAALGRKLTGGDFFASQPPPTPEVNDEASRVLNEPWSMNNAFSAKKWGATIVNGISGSWPELAAAGAGGLVGGPLGAAAGFSLATAAERLLPNFYEQQKLGKDPDTALKDSLKATGIDTGVAALAGLVPGAEFLDVLGRPIADAMIKAGVVQPILGVGGLFGHAAVAGTDVTPNDVINTAVGQAGMGIGFEGVHAGLSAPWRAERFLNEPATNEGVDKAFRDTVGKNDPAPREIEGPVVAHAALETEGEPATFFSRVQEVVQKTGPNNATAQQWLATIKNAPGVKSDEVESLKLPQWLADRQGKVSKTDLLTHIEENQVRVEEKLVEDKAFKLPDFDPEAWEVRQTGRQTDAWSVRGSFTMPNGEIRSFTRDIYPAANPHDARVRALRNLQIELEQEMGRTDRTTYSSYRLPGPIERYGELRFYWHGGAEPFVDPMQHFSPEHSNVVGWARYTTRVDRDGMRTLVAEELQSPWGQRGREAGFLEQNETRAGRYAKNTAEYDAKRKEWLAAVDQEKAARKVHDDALAGKLSPDERYSAFQKYFDIQTKTMQLRKELGNIFTKRDMEHYAQPWMPFKSNWEDLLFKRLMRYAADNGIQRLAWTNGDQQVLRYPGLDEKQQAGMREFYDKKLPRLAESWAKKLGMWGGETRLQPGETSVDALADSPLRYLELNPAAASRVKLGLPLFSRETGVTVAKGSLEAFKNADKESVRAMVKVTEELTKAFRITAPVEIDFQPLLFFRGEKVRGLTQPTTNGYRISMSTVNHASGSPRSLQEIYATFAHELGHVVFYEKWAQAPNHMIKAVNAAFARYRETKASTLGDLLKRRDNAIITALYAESGGLRDRPMLSLTPEQTLYWTGFKEWAAEETAKWATTSTKPLGIVDKYFWGLGDSIREIVQMARKKFGLTTGAPSMAMKMWLDSFIDSVPSDIIPDRVAMADLETMRSAQASLARDGTPEVRAVPLDAGSMTIRSAIHAALGTETPAEAAADMAHVDRFNAAYKLLISTPQLAELNPHIKPLQYYRDAIGAFNTKLRQDMEIPMETMRQWRKLRDKQADAVAGLIDDMTNQKYRTADEVSRQIRRMPTEEEFKKLVKENGVSDQGLAVFKKAFSDLQGRIGEMQRILTQRAMRIPNDIDRMVKINDIQKMVDEIKRAPYFPFLRTGRYTVTMYDAAGNVKHFDRFDTVKGQQAEAARLEKLKGAGEKVLPGQFAKDVPPLFGLPPAMLDAVQEALSVSAAQKAAIPMLKFEHTAEQSALWRGSKKNLQPGRGRDFIRAYANYWFHGSRNFVRADWAQILRGYIQDVRNLRRTRADATKIDQIANHMSRHLDYVLNPKPDFAALRGFIFSIRLGFSPTTATLYLTQTPLGTYPWLASGFGGVGVGDARAIAAIMRASGKLSNYYKSASVEKLSGPEMRGKVEAMRQRILDGGAAPELAAVADGRNLSTGFGKNAASRAWLHYQEMSGTLLHLADTWNRRVAFDAAWDLAMAHPEAKAIERAKTAYPADYQRLLDMGWSEREAGAYVAGRHTVEGTHFVYQRSHRPELMWGKKSALLMFKFWQQNMLFTLWNYPSVAARSLLVMGAMGGLMGLPFGQNFNQVFKALGWQLFGKDWDLDKELRKWFLDMWGEKGAELADSVLHGAARNGMGIPQVMESLGHLVDARIPYPNVDRSSAMGMGDILPVDANALFGPHKDASSVIARESQSMAGAAFGFWYDVYKMLTDTQLGWKDAKRYEQVAPHWIANASRAFRWFSEGRERDREGNTIIRFDPHDTAQMAEIIARALGYNPARLTKLYDARTMEREAETLWDVRHEVLLRQWWDAKKSGDKDETARMVAAIRKFNADLPQEAKPKAITSDAMLAFAKQRATKAAMIGQGLPASKKNIPLQRSIQQLFPQAEQVGRRNVGAVNP